MPKHPNAEIEEAAERLCVLLGWSHRPEHDRPRTILLAVEKLAREVDTLRAERNTYIDKLRTQGTLAAQRIRALEAEIEQMRASGRASATGPGAADASVPLRCGLCGYSSHPGHHCDGTAC